MYRSISTSRVSDDGYTSIYNNQSPTSKGVSPALRALSLEANELPPYEPSASPFSMSSKKEKARGRSSERGVHLIPLALLLCALLLWLFSNPDIEMPVKDDLIANKVKEMTLEGDIENDDVTTQMENSIDADMTNIGIDKHGDHHKLASTLGT